MTLLSYKITLINMGNQDPLAFYKIIIYKMGQIFHVLKVEYVFI